MNKSYLASFAAAVSLVVSSNSGAVEPGQWYFSPNLSYVIADSDRAADNDFGLQLGFGRALSKSWNIELSGVMDTLDLESGAGEYKQRGLQLDGLYFINRDLKVDPYFVFGVGGMKTSFASNKDTNLMANVGVGVSHLITKTLSLRADARYRIDEDDKSVAGNNRFGDWIVNIGLFVPFGSSKAAAEPVAAAVVVPAVVDTDGDGVNDVNDRCTDTPAGVIVDANGCELDGDNDGVIDRLDSCPETMTGLTVDAKGCELDGDNDGVTDRLDSCPETMTGLTVDAKGCELDSDSDGVVDSADNCANTVSGTKVDVHGCEIPEVVVLKGVHFNTGSNQLTETSMVELNDVAASLKKHSDLVVEVAGYTDNTGPKQLNYSLSQQRAESVVDYLISQGVDAANLTAKGYGPEAPIADNSTPAGRAENRRVELHIAE